jgi:hypothetical protein
MRIQTSFFALIDSDKIEALVYWLMTLILTSVKILSNVIFIVFRAPTSSVLQNCEHEYICMYFTLVIFLWDIALRGKGIM